MKIKDMLWIFLNYTNSTYSEAYRYERRNVDWAIVSSNLEFGVKIGTGGFRSDKFEVYIIIKIMGFNFLKMFKV